MRFGRSLLALPDRPRICFPTRSPTRRSVLLTTTFNVYRNGTLIASGLTASVYQDTGLPDGVLVSYQVSATVGGVEGLKSNVATATPVATPPPPPPGRPFAAPITSGTVNVPLSIDHTGATDVAAVLNTFIAGVPNGRIIQFPPDPTYIYQMSQGIQFANRNNLVFAGGGVTLKVGAGAAGTNQLTSPFCLGHTYGGFWDNNNTDIQIHDFAVIGNSPTPGIYIPGTEAQHILSLTGTTRLEVYNVVGSAAYGDGIFWESVTDGWAHNCHIPTTGRNGATVMGATTRVITELSAFDVSGYYTCDFEPNDPTQFITNGYFRNNTAGSWGHGSYGGGFFALEGSHTGAAINGAYVTGNTISGDAIKAVCDNGGTSRMKNVIFSNNTSTAGSVGGPVLTFAHIDGLTVQHNAQPLSSGSLVSLTDCTLYSITPNP